MNSKELERRVLELEQRITELSWRLIELEDYIDLKK